MSCSGDNSRNLFCVCYTDHCHGQKFYVNFKSDSREKSSIKLPQFMIEMSQQPPETESDPIKESINVFTHTHQMEVSITRSLIAWYGRRMPTIYLTEDGEDLVMNVHIFKDHAEALKKLPLEEPKIGLLRAKWQLLLKTMIIIKSQIQSALDNTNENKLMQIAPFETTLLKDIVRMPTGEKATRDRMAEFVRIDPERVIMPEKAEELTRMSLIPETPIKVGTKLFSYGWRDDQLKRSAHYNFVVSDDPKSLRLAPFMLNIARAATNEKAHALAKNMSAPQVVSIMKAHVEEMLIIYHQKHQLQVFIDKQNQVDLVVNVPLHIDHVPLLPKCFPGNSIMSAFFASVLGYYHTHFEFERRHCHDLEVNRIFRHTGLNDARETGRRATDEEVRTLLFKKKGSQPSHDQIREQMDKFIKLNDFRLMDAKEMTKHVINDFS